MEYSYPIDPDWTTEEIVNVVELFQKVEEAYEQGTNTKEVLHAYNEFKKVVPSKAEEKTLFKEFEKKSGFVPYQVIQKAKAADNETIKM
ncbi:MULTISPECIES: UPF0223 family protein [Allobacillus]|uniref:UPF0223 protein FPQ13_07325 n=1 Tax=Allobacillus salarius TaxID=1955272 RepID=A0A556PLZ6_9BACI|nr:UPF0223 family protein [Allobacillus salarius]TSJ65369.1 UPF0223 family protein [Allobacillus salarius]